MKLKQLAFIGLGGLLSSGIIACQLISPLGSAFAQDQETLTILERLDKLAEGTGSYHADVKTVMTTRKGKIRIWEC